MNTETIHNTDEISIKDLVYKVQNSFKYLLSKWIIIFLFVIIGSILGFLYTVYKPVTYIASSTFVLEESGSGSGAGALGQYSGIASMVGLDLGGGGGGIFQGDNLLELYRSKNMLRKTLLSKANFNGREMLLVDRYIEINRLRSKWEEDKLKKISFNESDKVRDRTKDSLINVFINDIRKINISVTKPDKKLSIIAVDVRSKDELFSLAFNNLLVENVNDFYVQTKTKKSQENLNVLQHQTDSIRRSLDGAISNVAASLDANPNANPSRLVLRVPSQKRQVDADANKAILTELVKNLELSKITLRKETPLIQLIDEPNLPLDKESVTKTKGIVLGAFLGMILTILFLLLKRLMTNIMS